MTRDILFLLQPRFADPAYGGQVFYCEHCVLMEGVLAAFPELAERIEVRRVPWPRPRPEVVALAGEANQGLPMLVLADDAPDGLETGRHGDVRFVNEKAAILKALAARHGIPLPHP
ncbi:MAG TPA: DUF3088 family protein [Azospirillaceae bacterium]|nr:DUF3088 family protein [Azospirillaceae bacterium]